MKYTDITKPGMGDPYWYEWSVGIKELQQSHEKVIFLSGIPGTGKTNIISKLSAKRNSLVDIRYYAYEPIFTCSAKCISVIGFCRCVKKTNEMGYSTRFVYRVE